MSRLRALKRFFNPVRLHCNAAVAHHNMPDGTEFGGFVLNAPLSSANCR
jgi:hypothetical protein